VHAFIIRSNPEQGRPVFIKKEKEEKTAKPKTEAKAVPARAIKAARVRKENVDDEMDGEVKVCLS
jgi:hypothetical protein